MKKYIFLLPILFFDITIYSQNIGIGTTSPTDKLHINAAVGINPLRVQANGATKLRVFENGGTAVGGLTTPPVKGLLVQGSIQPQDGITAVNKLIIECTNDSMIFNAGGSQVIIAANVNIIIKSGVGNKLIIDSGGDLELKGLNIKIQATSIITMNGTLIKLNGGTRQVARVGDVVGGAPTGTIVSGSATVLVDN